MMVASFSVTKRQLISLIYTSSYSTLSYYSLNDSRELCRLRRTLLFMAFILLSNSCVDKVEVPPKGRCQIRDLDGFFHPPYLSPFFIGLPGYREGLCRGEI